MGERWDSLRLTAFILVAAPLLFALTPGLIPAVQFVEARRRRQMSAAAMTTRCASCGCILGIAALERADMILASYMSELSQSHPGIRLRLACRVDACCVRCGAEYGFHEKQRRFCVRDAQ